MKMRVIASSWESAQTVVKMFTNTVEFYAYLRLGGMTWCWQYPTLSRYLDSDSRHCSVSDSRLSTECPDKLIDDPRRHPDIISELYLPRKQNWTGCTAGEGRTFWRKKVYTNMLSEVLYLGSLDLWLKRSVDIRKVFQLILTRFLNRTNSSEIYIYCSFTH